ncbi:MAG: hypothetical protein J0J06_03940 [Sphingomonas sp.]|uniref:hypothetical protein n=1 Tax=Sphingomonas sp. TaxID=28214 RepID=UPI001ACAD6F6|nr:hypothetical protein [Sphingomonas sp.]MBN8814582.1 hypothetical protein [Sphingomonas sp.]
MINIRNLLTGIAVGAVVALLVREINQFGLDFAQWSLRAPRVVEALVSGALIGAMSQLVGQSRGRR